MSDQKPNAEWSVLRPNHVNALLGLLVIATVWLGLRLACNPTFLDDPAPDTPPRMADLADRMDPNTATWQELAAIPGLGEKKAQAIVAYREKWLRNHPDQPAFAKPGDLRAIKGIGPATISNMSPYLMFSPTTRPVQQ